MASLTDQTQDPSAGKRLVAPAQPAPSVFGGLAGAATDFLGASSKNYEESQQIQTSKALNETERGVTNLRMQAEQAISAPVGPGFYDDPSNVNDRYDLPPDLLAQKQALDKTSRGIAQGRAATSQLAIQLENFQQTIEAQYPDQSAKIGTYMRQEGYTHYMWRGTNDALAAQESDTAAMNSGRAAMIDLARKSGIDPSGTATPDQLYESGSNIAAIQHQALIFKQVQEEKLAAVKEGREQSTFDDARSDKAAFDYGSSMVTASLGQIHGQLANLLNGAPTNSSDAFSQIEKLVGQSDQYVANLKAHVSNAMTSQGASPVSVKGVMDQIDQQQQGIRDLTTGPMSSMQQNFRSLTNMRNMLNISVEKALPLYTSMKSQLGESFVAAAFGNDPTHMLSPEMQTKIQGELLQYDPMKPNTGFKILQEVGAMVKGNINLADQPEGWITGDHVRGLVASINGAGPIILDPARDNPTARHDFLGAFGNVVIAASDIHVGNKDLPAQQYAIDAIASSTNINIQDKLIKDPAFKQQALPTFLASRSAAANILEVARSATSVQLQNKNGQFVAPRGADTVSFANNIQIKAPGVVDPNAKKQADIMNKAVDYLVNTAKADPRTAGVDPTVLRDHYMNGTPLPVTDGDKKPPVDWQQSMNEFERQLAQRGKDLDTQMPLQNYVPGRVQYEPLVHQAAAAHNVDPKVAMWLFNHENAQWDPNLGTQIMDAKGKPASTAKGLGQITEPTGKLLGLIHDGVDERTNPTKSIPAAVGYLSSLIKKHGGDTLAALHDYGTLAKSNFKNHDGSFNQQAYETAVASAQSAIGGQ